MTDKLKYNTEQRREYLNMIDRVGGHWLGARIWRSDGPVTKTEALRCMTGVKSAHTAGKYLETAIREGLLIEQENPEDKRSRIIVLAPVMKQRLDRFFDGAVSEVRQANRTFARPRRQAGHRSGTYNASLRRDFGE
jgi:hypothetical protein